MGSKLGLERDQGDGSGRPQGDHRDHGDGSYGLTLNRFVVILLLKEGIDMPRIERIARKTKGTVEHNGDGSFCVVDYPVNLTS